MLKLIWDSVRCSKRIFLSECKTYRDRLYYWNCLVIPDYNELKLKLLKYVYNLLVAGYLGWGKTLELL